MSRTTDRIKSSWGALVRHLLPPTIDLYAFYPAKVVGQSADGTTVDVQPDSSRLPPMTQLPMELPPGYAAKVDVSKGPRVMIGWKEGDPSRPFASPAWDPSTAVLSVSITGGAVQITAGVNESASMKASGTGVAEVTADPVTGTVKLGPVGNLAVLVQGAFDSMGVPVTQAPAALLTVVKAG